MMDTFDLLVQQMDEKIVQLRDHVAEGKAATFEEYKRLCGEIRGLLIAQGYTLDLKRKMERADD